MTQRKRKERAPRRPPVVYAFQSCYGWFVTANVSDLRYIIAEYGPGEVDNNGYAIVHLYTHSTRKVMQHGRLRSVKRD